MISTNTSSNSSQKLKASKSSRDIIQNSYEINSQPEESNENNVELVLGNSRYHGRESRYRNNVGRSRSTEFKATRISDRRAILKGRNNWGSSRRDDREFSDPYSKKYESVRNTESLGNGRNKFYEPEKKVEIKLNLPEDLRISKLLRRLSNETNQDNSLAISTKLLEVLLYPDNASYVRKAFHILGDSMYEILYVSPGSPAKNQAARALGRMGYIMAQEDDFDRYQSWLFSKMNKSNEEVQMLLMKSFTETFQLEAKKPLLRNYDEVLDNLIGNLVGAIETTENAEVFKAILDTLVTVVELYPEAFNDQFRDTIDLLFGWHVDHTQPLYNIEFISKSLLRISHHFKYNLEFSVNLIENFLEDIANYSSQLNDPNESSSIEHVTVLVLALNTVLKCLNSSFHPNNNKFIKSTFITNCLTRIIKTCTEAVESYVPDNLIIAANDCISLLFGVLDNKTQNLSTQILNLIDLELGIMNDLSEPAIVSILLFISKLVKELSVNLPTELIEKLIGPNSEVIKLRTSTFRTIKDSVICVYQTLLNLKNVSLLQEAYRYVLGDLEEVYRKLVPDIEPFIQNNPFSNYDYKNASPELTSMFLLRCLSQLANASSIIVMWALKPSILELIGVHLEVFKPSLAKSMPYLQYSLLYLLYSHCKCYNHFISTSRLVGNKDKIANMMTRFSEGLNMNDVPNMSPNSGNFTIILDIIYKTLNVETSTEVTLLILQWLNDILINADMYLESLYCDEYFTKVTNVLVKCGYHFNEQIAIAVADSLDKLLNKKQLSWNNVFLTNITNLCKLHLNSTKANVRTSYTKLVANIPWDIAIVGLNREEDDKKCVGNMNYSSLTVYKAQQLHLNGTLYSEMNPMQFKTFMNFLLMLTNDNVNLEDLFTTCWNVQSDAKMELFYDLATNSQQVLNNWATLEAAQFCVNYKLRTPLGKPNETFTKIEGTLNQIGNDLLKKQSNEQQTVQRVRLLLHFIEHLEKAIYNSFEGCAIAMPQPTKQVRSFFYQNMNTCNEWLSRIRIVVMHIALHSNEPNIALRHGQNLLKEMNNAKRVKTPEFDKVVLFVTLALLNLKEYEALIGLYTWCKHLGKRFVLIKYAAEQAGKRYEIAVKGYRNLLSEMDDLDDVEVRNFIIDQIIVCYKELNNFVDLYKWYEEYNEITQNGRKYWFNLTDWECNQNLYNFEVGNNAFNSLSTWEYKKNDVSWSAYQNLTKTETNLYNVGFKFLLENQEMNVIAKEIDDTMNNIEICIENHLESAPSEFLQTYSLLQYVSYGLKHVVNGVPSNTVFLVSENFENELNKIDSSVLRKILWWSEYFTRIQNQGFNTFCSNLRLDIIKRARKEKNVTSALHHVYKFFKNKDELLFAENECNVNIAKLFTEKVSDISVWSMDMAKAVFETIKLSYIEEENRQDCFNLCASSSTAISKYAELFGSPDLRKISSRILLKLAKWLQLNENVNLMEMNSPLGKFLMVLPEISMMENVDSNVIPLNEMAIGKLMQFSVQQCSSLAKSWNCFGTWCYRWGKKIVDQTSKNNLSDEHCLEVRQLLPNDTSEEDITKICHILSKTRAIIDDEDIDSNEINTSEMIQNQLQNVQVLQNATEEQLRALVQIWRNTQKRIYNCYALSADAYFKYLHLVLTSENITKSTEYNTITVTLRLLRLIVKYALELQNILEEGLQTTPTQPWKVIIPQLFSRLNHPESYVRLRVSDLLCRVAGDAPHLITFPAVVGALEGGLKFDFSEITLPKDCLSQNNECNEENENEEEDNNYDSDTEEETNTLQTCFKTMVDTLSKQDPETITQVQTLVKELRRITLLWDELWLGTLAQHQSEILKRQQQLEYEIEKVNENANLNKDEKKTLIVEKHRIIIKPIVYILEQLQDVTSVEAQTPHEKQFQEKYLTIIHEVIDKLKNPENPERPQDSLLPLKQLQKKFQQKFHKRASYTLKMQDISPILANMKNTVITMPGLATTAKKNVTISHVSNILSILPTKTKPKKLVFYGSDGQTYTYLFKGLEDLHLDERIMQFLSITNTMMAQNADPAENNLYRARHYSVIPLGPRSGLISWVDGTMPVFALYKRWQQREIAKPTTKNAINTNSTNILRPSELFYNKLNPLLKEHGVKNIENRKEWPLSVLRNVLLELMNDTPNDLLAKELWCNAISAGKWWQVVKRYSYSMAVMSIIGYIIGLGDRHLDNVLIDLDSGDVVHIDYNVCFEKGKTLRVPEKVPFRLTPNIQEALGVTGVEGIFRLACENVLKTMRKGRETLLTLLEAFVYDPLIDWTVSGEVLAGTTFGELANGNHGRQSKKDLEKEITLSMFNVRCTEMKTEWKENKEEVLSEIPKLVKSLNTFGLIKQQLRETEDKLQDLHQQLALVKEAEAQGLNKHSLYRLPSRFESYHKMQCALNTAKTDLDIIIAECENQLKVHNEARNLYECQQFAHWMNEMKMIISKSEKSMHVFDLVREFLHNAGKDDIIEQCEQSENDVAQLMQHVNGLTCNCLQLLQDYFTILSQCPTAYVENHRMNQMLKWCHYLLQNRNLESCELVYAKLKDCLDVNKNNNRQQNLLKFVFTLETLYKETIQQVNKMYEELQSKEITMGLEAIYQSAKLGVTNFLASERGATSALEFVIVSELIVLNQSFLCLEVAAHRSGDWLIKLTSRNGDWFLDDLVLNSCLAVELINNLPINRSNMTDEGFLHTVNAINISNNIYKALDDLNFNFQTIILPESMKKIQSEDVTVIEMVNDLKQLIAGIEIPIPEFIAQLEKMLTCYIMQMDVDVSYDLLLDKLGDLKASFQMLIPSQTDSLTPGQMLLMGFNGLFETLKQEMSTLVQTIKNLDIPMAWRKLDQVKEAKSISAHLYNPSVMKILEDIFFLKKLHAMSEVFGLCQEMCESFKPNDIFIIYTDEQLIKPIRQFIADFISQQLLGTTTENIAYLVCFLLEYLGLDVTHQIEQKDIGAESKVPLDELYQKEYNYLLKNNIFTANVLSQASSLETNLKLAWEKIQEPKKLEHKLNILQSCAIRLQTHLTVCNFMYDDLNLCNNSVRTKYITDIKTEMGKLQTVYTKLIEMREKQKQLIENAYQRLNWAKGANPNVVEILAAFESAVATRNNQLNIQQQIATNTLNTCSTIFNYELSRSFISPEAKLFNKTFVNSFEKWRMACQYSNSNNDVLSPTEESILNLLTPELIAKPKWLEIVGEQLTDIIAGTQQQLSDEKAEMFLINDELMSLVSNFKALYNVHTKLMADVKTLIKNMMKIDEYNGRAVEYINEYREYIECFTMIFGNFKKQLEKEDIDALIDLLNDLKENTNGIYEGLMELDMKKVKRAHLVRQNDVIENSKLIKQESMSKGQQRNAYAVSVWRRVKMKLEGRDPDPGRKYTTQEQVDYVIREATNLDNLALLYEGWTPWV